MEGMKKRVFIGKSGRINPETGRELRERRFRIRDNYARFYLKCVEPNKRIIDDGAFSFASLDQLEGWDSIMGLAFENMVVNNYRELIPHLHLGGAVIVSAGRLRWVLRRHRAVRFTASRQTIAIHYP